MCLLPNSTDSIDKRVGFVAVKPQFLQRILSRFRGMMNTPQLAAQFLGVELLDIARLAARSFINFFASFASGPHGGAGAGFAVRLDLYYDSPRRRRR